MTTEFVWTVPVRGDGRAGPGALGSRGDWTSGGRPLVASIRDVRTGQFNYFDHLFQVGRAAAVTGFDGVVVPFDPEGEDSWIVSSALARELPNLDVVTEFDPAFATPVYAAKMSATFQRFTGGRLQWKLSIDAEPDVAHGFGDWVEGADRYQRADEFLDVAEGLWQGLGFNYEGRFYGVEDGGFRDPLTRYPRPSVITTGTAPEALALAAKHADVHLWAALPGPESAERRTSLDRLAADEGRTIRHGEQLAVFARETTDEAWDEVRRLWLQSGAGGWDEFDELIVSDQLWAGFRLLGYQVPIGIVGSHHQVAAHLQHAIDAGIDVFHLAASPRLEEAYRFGEHIAPLLADPIGIRQAV